MHKLKNFIFGPGRLNRRQFLIMVIVTGFIIGTISFIASIGVVAYFGASETSGLLVLVMNIILELFIGFPLMMGYTRRRGYDFGVQSLYSTAYVIMLITLTILPGIYDLLGKFSIILEGIMIITFLIFLFHRGDKGPNQYGNPPIDTGKPKRIFKYMQTGNWDN